MAMLMGGDSGGAATYTYRMRHLQCVEANCYICDVMMRSSVGIVCLCVLGFSLWDVSRGVGGSTIGIESDY